MTDFMASDSKDQELILKLQDQIDRINRVVQFAINAIDVELNFLAHEIEDILEDPARKESNADTLRNKTDFESKP